MIGVREHFESVDDLMEHYRQIMKRTKEREEAALVKNANLLEQRIRDDERRRKEEAQREEEERAMITQEREAAAHRVKHEQTIKRLKCIVNSDGLHRGEWCNALLALMEIENNLPKGSLKGTSRVVPIPQVRQEAMVKILEKYADAKIPASLSWIGRFFGLDHTTVMHGVRRAREKMNMLPT
jgi:hypothetical protein